MYLSAFKNCEGSQIFQSPYKLICLPATALSIHKTPQNYGQNIWKKICSAFLRWWKGKIWIIIETSDSLKTFSNSWWHLSCVAGKVRCHAIMWLRNQSAPFSELEWDISRLSWGGGEVITIESRLGNWSWASAYG